jgi:hypothetical protein
MASRQQFVAGAMTLIKMTFDIATLRIMAFSKVTLSIVVKLIC